MRPRSPLVQAIAGVTGGAADGAFTGGADRGIPTTAQVAAVTAHLEALRPMAVDLTVAAPSPVPLDLTINAVTPDTPEVRAAIAAELADLIERTASPGGPIRVSHLREAISAAEGETDHELTAPAGTGNPPAVTHGAAEIAVAGVISWT